MEPDSRPRGEVTHLSKATALGLNMHFYTWKAISDHGMAVLQLVLLHKNNGSSKHKDAMPFV